MVPVGSSTLALVGFLATAPSCGDLTIAFRTGHLYRYEGVEEHVHAALLAAPSKGVFFHARIRGRYPFRRLE